MSLSALYQLRISYIKVLNRVTACIRYWKITTNMNRYLKEATPQDFYEYLLCLNLYCVSDFYCFLP